MLRTTRAGSLIGSQSSLCVCRLWGNRAYFRRLCEQFTTRRRACGHNRLGCNSVGMLMGSAYYFQQHLNASSIASLKSDKHCRECGPSAPLPPPFICQSSSLRALPKQWPQSILLLPLVPPCASLWGSQNQMRLVCSYIAAARSSYAKLSRAHRPNKVSVQFCSCPVCLLL
jgi:hypothetical protein